MLLSTERLGWLRGGADGGEQGSRTDLSGRSGYDFQTTITPLLKLSAGVGWGGGDPSC